MNINGHSTMSNNTQFDSECQSTPIAYVREHLSVSFLLMAVVAGVFVALTLSDGIEIFEDHERPLGFVCIPLSQVQSMELRNQTMAGDVMNRTSRNRQKKRKTMTISPN
jgi:hypothetical protein